MPMTLESLKRIFPSEAPVSEWEMGKGTRGKIQAEAFKCVKYMDSVLVCLKRMDALAEDKHPLLNERLPSLVTLFSETRKMMDRFSREL